MAVASTLIVASSGISLAYADSRVRVLPVAPFLRHVAAIPELVEDRCIYSGVDLRDARRIGMWIP